MTDPLDPNNKVLKTELLPGNDRTEVSVTNTALQVLHIYTNASPGFTDTNNTVADNRSLGSEIWINMLIYKPQEQNTNGLKPSIVQLRPTRHEKYLPSLGSNGFWQLRLRNDTSAYGDHWNSRLFGNTNYTPLALNSDTLFVSKPHRV